MQRLQAIYPFLKNLNITEVEDLLTGCGDEKKHHSLIDDLQNLDSLTKMLQRDNVSLPQAREMFKATIKEFSGTETRLSIDTGIVYRVSFESSIAKILNLRSEEFFEEERELVCDLKRVRDISSSSGNFPVSFSEAAFKKQRAENNYDEFIDNRFITPNSYICERLFYVSGYALG